MALRVRWPFRRKAAGTVVTIAPAEGGTPAPGNAHSQASDSARGARPPAGPPPLDPGFASGFRARADARDAATVLGPWGGLGETARFAVSATHFARDAFVTQRWSDDVAGRAEQLAAPDTTFAAGLATLASYHEPSGAPGEDGSVFAATLPVAGGGTNVFTAGGSGAAPTTVARTPAVGGAMRDRAAAIDAAIRAAEGPTGAGGGFLPAPRATTRPSQPVPGPVPRAELPRGIARTADAAAAATAGPRARSRVSEPPSSLDTTLPPATAAHATPPAAPGVPLAATSEPPASTAAAREPSPEPLADRDAPPPLASAADGPEPAGAMAAAPGAPLPLAASSERAEPGGSRAEAVHRAIAAAEGPAPGAPSSPAAGPPPSAPSTGATAGASSTPSTATPATGRRDIPAPAGNASGAPIARSTGTVPPLGEPLPPGAPTGLGAAALPLAAQPVPPDGGTAEAGPPASSRADAVQRAIAAAEAPAPSGSPSPSLSPMPSALAAGTTSPPFGAPEPAAPQRPARPRRFAIGEPVAGDLPIAGSPLAASASSPAAPAAVARRTDTAGDASPRAALTTGGGPPLVLARTPSPAPVAPSGDSDAPDAPLGPQSAALPLFRVADDAPLPIEPPVAAPATTTTTAAQGGPLVRAATDVLRAAVARTNDASPFAAPGPGSLPFAAPAPQPLAGGATPADAAGAAAFAPGPPTAGGALPLQRFVPPASPAVQRVTAPADAMTDETPAVGTIVAAEGAGAPPAAEPDLDRLTEKVWQRIRRTLQLERERRRGLP